jgi:hypothetical protein
MSLGALDRPTFEAIEAYVLDRMAPAERAAFEQRMADDAALRAEVELERENIRAVELGGMERIIRRVREEHAVRREQGGGWTTWLKYAAVVAVLLGGALWFILRPSTNERLFAEHFAPDPGLPVAMGATDDPAFADAMVSYKEGKYAEARAKWEPMALAHLGNDTLRYYLASAALGMGDVDFAVPLLEGVAADPASAFAGKARWYLFLAYIRKGERQQALSVPLDDDPVYGERVRKLKTQLAK